MLRGFTNVSFWADDVPAARQWYIDVLGIEPYFQRPDAENPAYIEFRIGDYQHELGLIDRRYARDDWDTTTGGVVLYWQVDDVPATFEKLLSMGAKEYEPIIEREAGFVTAAVVDPFGNILGLMYSPHYLEVLQSAR
jgi:predicted enzyme related to lactoylglutathione lyase